MMPKSAQPERWFVLSAHLAPGDPLRELAGEALLALGAHAVLETEGELTVYLSPPADPERLLAEARSTLADWIGGESPALSWRWQSDQDWEVEWRRGLQPRKISPRLVVKPSWTAWEAAPEEVVLTIDPQMAFGTGEHATTRGCLLLIDQLIEPGDRVLDVGSGSAILSIAAARLGADRVLAIEYDPDANVNARENLEAHGVEEIVELREELADAELVRASGPFDLILANILSGIIRPLLPAFAGALCPGGRLIVSGILQSERAQLLEDALAAGLQLDREQAEEEWWSAAFRAASAR